MKRIKTKNVIFLAGGLLSFLIAIGLVPAILGPTMNITGSLLASWGRERQNSDPSAR